MQRLTPYDRRSREDNRPGCWWFIIEQLVGFSAGQTLRPDVAGWRRERLPEPPSDEDTVVHVRPDWIAEIVSTSNAANDLVKKKKKRIESEAGALHRVPVEPFGLLCEVADAHRTVARDKGVTLHVAGDSPQSLGPVAVDPERISIALANLVSNAVRHTPAGGKVTLEATRDERSLRIQVSDDGEGIAQSDLSSIFDRPPASSGGADGSPRHGLGLTIAREIVLQHGGELVAESEPGKGSVFTMVLPLDGGG